MADVTFRTKIEPVKETPQNIVGDGLTTSIVHEEVPHTMFKAENGKPFTAEYFELGDTWEVFNEEVSTLEHFINRMIENGTIANSTTAVKKEIKKMEKLKNVEDESRTVVKIGVLASYIKHLNDIDGIRFNWRKYNG